MQGPYADHILDAKDVCSNCLRQNRVERIDPVMGSGLGHELDSHYSRDRRQTVIGFGPAEAVADSKGVFCECGVEGSYERIWDPEEVGEDRFRDLLVAAVATLERKDVSIRRRTALRTALQHFQAHGDVDRALSIGAEAAVVAEATGG